MSEQPTPSSADSFVIRAPSRLHFGLLAIAPACGRQFGGVGVMVDAPGVQLTVRPGERLEVDGPLSERAWVFARRYLAAAAKETGDPPDRACPVRLKIGKVAPTHVGLGTGTQLALSVARALARWVGQPHLSVEELACRVGRGARSAIGIHGFQRGGLLVDGGKRVEESVAERRAAAESPSERTALAASEAAHRKTASSIAPLLARVALPDDWRWVLCVPRRGAGLHGDAERDALERLSRTADPRSTDRLCRLALLGLLPAAVGGDFPAFSQALYEFGRCAGECFSSVQGGVYASDEIAGLVEGVRADGTVGVGQSSWGPTVFALAEDASAAAALKRRIEGRLTGGSHQVVVTRTNNEGARLCAEAH